VKPDAALGVEGTVILKPGREGPARAGHPWIFSGAIAEFRGEESPGAWVRVLAGDSSLIGMGSYNPRGAIAIRLVTRGEAGLDAGLVRNRIDDALRLRQATGLAGDGGFRLVNGEGDSLPGVVVDVYAGFAVLQIITAGAERWRDWILAALADLPGLHGVFERSAGGARRDEGLEDRTGVAWGETPPERVEIAEGAARFQVDVRTGQKTGFYLDQRGNRARVGGLARGHRVLNCFAYSGGFAVHAGLGEAREVVSVESSGPALRLARENWELNGLDPARAEWVNADVFDYLTTARGHGEPPFDLIVLDPPPFARHRNDRDRAIRGYRDLNRRALRLLEPGGLLFTFSCSPHVARDAFEHVVATSAGPGMRLQLLERPSFESDHPVLAAHGEGEYLKGLVVRLAVD